MIEKLKQFVAQSVFHKGKIESVLIATGIVIIALLPITFFATVAEDDGFMYFTLARSGANGHLLSADNGNSSTNGFQPLWYTLLTSLFYIAKTFGISNYDTAKIAFSLSWIFLVCSSYLVKRIVEATPLNKAASATQILMIFNPYFIVTALNGLETMLYGMLLLFTFYAVIYKKSLVVICLTTALSVLTRLDAMLFLIPLLLVAERDQVKTIAVSAAGAYALYIATNFALFNQFTPYSQQLKSFKFVSMQHFLFNGLLTLARTIRSAVFFPKVLAIFTIVTSAASFRSFKVDLNEKWTRVLVCLTCSAVLYIAYYSFIVFPSPWHHYPLMFLLWGMLIPAGLIAADKLTKKTQALLLVLIIVEVAIGAGFFFASERTFNLTFYSNAVEVSEKFPGANVCAYNFGITAFFAKNNTTINLDGLMNNDIAKALLKNDSSDIEYIETHCDFILDAEASIAPRYLSRGGKGEVVKNVSLNPRKCILEYCQEIPTERFLWVAVSVAAISNSTKLL